MQRAVITGEPRLDLVLRDIEALGWSTSELTRRINVQRRRRGEPAIAVSTVTRYLNGSVQTPATLALITRALGKPRGFYLPKQEGLDA